MDMMCYDGHELGQTDRKIPSMQVNKHSIMFLSLDCFSMALPMLPLQRVDKAASAP